MRMRRLDAARGVDVVLAPLVADASDAVPLTLLAPGAVVVVPAAPLVAPFEVLVEVSVLVPFDTPLVARVESVVPLVAGRVRSTSPVDVFVTVPGDALFVDRTQSVVLIAESVLLAVVVDETLSRVAALTPVVLVDGVVPVPFAPFVVFSPLKR